MVFAKNRRFVLTALISLLLLSVVQCASAELGNNIYGYNESDTLTWVGYEPNTLDKFYPRYEAFDGRNGWNNWYANVFTAGSDEDSSGADVEVIKSASFYAKEQVDHDIYIYLDPAQGNPANGDPISHTHVDAGMINAGPDPASAFNLVELSTPVPICKGQGFSVVIKVHSSDKRPVPIEWTWHEGDQLKYPTCSPGQSYIGYEGYEGLSWVDMKDTRSSLPVYSNSNVLIKAYTEERAKGDEVQGVIFVPNGPEGYWAQTIEGAVGSAPTGGIVVVKPGTYPEHAGIYKEVSIIAQSGNPSDTIVESPFYNADVFEVYSDNVTIRDLSIKGASSYEPLSGVNLNGVKNCLIANNEISGNWHGIFLESSNSNRLINNIVSSNNGYGFSLRNSCRNHLGSNTVFSNDDGAFYLRDSAGNTLADNAAYKNEGYGFLLSFSEDNGLISNNVTDNGYGIRLEDSSDRNEVTGNEITLNRAYGITTFFSENNSIFDNYFNNANNAHFEETGSINSWNSTREIKRWNIVYGDYQGGNYWARPDGKGFSQTHEDADGDGICDINGSVAEYSLTEGNPEGIDRLPLADPKIRLVGIGDAYPYNVIQDALDHSRDNFTLLVHPGDYFESVYVYREVDIKSGTLVPADVNVRFNRDDDLDDKYSTFYVISDNVSISGLNVKGSVNGAWLNEVERCTINNSRFSGSQFGVYLFSSRNNLLTGNVAFSNTEHGFWLNQDCQDNTLDNNTAESNLNSGFYLSSSMNNTLFNNKASSNGEHGIHLYASSDSNFLSCNNVSHNEYGIYLESVTNNRLAGNTVYENDYGVYLWSSIENLIRGNTIKANVGTAESRGYGVYLAIDSENNTVRDNTISDNRYGVRMGSHANNTHVFNNYFNNTKSNTVFEVTRQNLWNSSNPLLYFYNFNTYVSYLGNCYADYISRYGGIDENNDGIGDIPYPENEDLYPLMPSNWPVNFRAENCVENLNTGESFDTIQAAIDSDSTTGGDTIAIYPGTYTENVLVNKEVTIKSASGSPEDATVLADSLFAHVFRVTSDNVTIKGLTIKGASGHDPYSGIYLEGVEDCVIENNKLLDNWYGVYLYSSSNITLRNNEANDNRDYGIKLRSSSYNEEISNNTVNSNDYGGICLTGSSNNNILRDNTASSNLWYGIQLNSSSHNTLVNNTAVSNNNSGIYLKSLSNGNEVLDNTVESNARSGIFLNSSSSNLIFNNYFKNNLNARFEGSNLLNLWNSTGTACTNKVGGPTLGGNYWAEPGGNGFSQTHEDLDGDGICEGEYCLDGAEGENIDFLSLYLPTTLRVNWNGTMEFETIQEAVDFADEGFTVVVYPGTYNENVNVNKELAIRSYSGSPADTTVRANSSGNHVFNVSSDNVRISGFTVSGANKNGPCSGVYLGGVNNSAIENNILSDNWNGIYLDSACQGITLRNNLAAQNREHGIKLNNSGNNSLINNTANSNSAAGIYLEGSGNNSIVNNTANTNNLHGVWLYSSSHSNTLASNNANQNLEYGIILEYSCNYNILDNNTAASNSEYGICLKHASDFNDLAGNSANSNFRSGFWLYNHSSGNNLLDNSAESNLEHGIYLYDSSNNNYLGNNTVNSSGINGIYLRSSRDNRLIESNRIVNNAHGICLDNSHDNLIFNNYFNNSNNAFFEGPNTGNLWNTTKTEEVNVFGGPYLGGNFWAKPDGTGFSQINRDLTGDGILDYRDGPSGLEYTLTKEIVNPDELNIDRLPLARTLIVDPAHPESNPESDPEVSPEGEKRYANIQGAVNASEDGYSIAVYPGNYMENVVVSKSLAIISVLPENTTVTAADSSRHVFYVNSSGTILRGFFIGGANGSDSSSGIYLERVRDSTLADNSVSNNSVGIWLNSSGGDTPLEGNILLNNSMSSNKYNFKDSGTLQNEIGISNTVDGKPVYYLCGESGVEINSSSNAGTVYCIDCEDITVKDLVLTDNAKGISFYNTGNSSVSNNTLSGNYYGISLESSPNNNLDSNTAYENENSGIFLSASAFNFLGNNNVNENGLSGLCLFSSGYNGLLANNASLNKGPGLVLESSNNNSLRANVVSLNKGFGVKLDSSDNNIVDDNNLIGNSGYGISILSSGGNALSGNRVTSNDLYGIFLDTSEDNTLDSNIVNSNRGGFYLRSSGHNNFTDNSLLSNKICGFYLSSGNRFNRLVNNMVSACGSYGIYLEWSSEFNWLADNTVSDNRFGFDFRSSGNNTIFNNTVSDNYYGISLRDSSDYNNITANRVSSNSEFGISLDSSANNLIFNNYFNNARNADPGTGTFENSWNATKTPGLNVVEGPWIGGNYWASPEGTGLSQACTDIDPDYFCNEEYVLGTGNIDHLPLSDAPAWKLPIVDFSTDVSKGLAPLTVKFTAASSSSVGPIDWTWDFGDSTPVENGQKSTDFNYSGSAAHTYGAGEFTAGLRVGNVYGSGYGTAPIYVVEPIESSLSLDGDIIDINDTTKAVTVTPVFGNANIFGDEKASDAQTNTLGSEITREIINKITIDENVSIIDNETLRVRNEGFDLYIFSENGFELEENGKWRGKYTFARLEKAAESSELGEGLNVSFSFSADLTGSLSALLNPDAGISCGVVPGTVSDSMELAFRDSLASKGLNLDKVAYSLIIEEEGLDGINIRDASIIMTAPCAYIDNSGGPGKFAIMRLNNGKAGLLTTSSSSDGMSFTFECFSPEGFSVESLLSFTPKKDDSKADKKTGGGGGSSGGGGGGGGGSPEDQGNVEIKELTSQYVTSGSHVRFDFVKGVTIVDYIEFDARRSFGKVNAFVEMLKGQSTLVTYLPEGIVYRNLNIWVGTQGVATPENIENAVIGFRVNSTWISDNNIDESRITMHRYSEGSWSALPTYMLRKDGTFSYFEAKTPAFSPFVVTGSEKVVEIVPAEEPEIIIPVEPSESEGQGSEGSENAGSEAENDNSGILGKLPGNVFLYGIPVTVIVLLLGVLLAKKKFPGKNESPDNQDEPEESGDVADFNNEDGFEYEEELDDEGEFEYEEELEGEEELEDVGELEGEEELEGKKGFDDKKSLDGGEKFSGEDSWLLSPVEETGPSEDKMIGIKSFSPSMKNETIDKGILGIERPVEISAGEKQPGYTGIVNLSDETVRRPIFEEVSANEGETGSDDTFELPVPQQAESETEGMEDRSFSETKKDSTGSSKFEVVKIGRSNKIQESARSKESVEIKEFVKGKKSVESQEPIKSKRASEIKEPVENENLAEDKESSASEMPAEDKESSASEMPAEDKESSASENPAEDKESSASEKPAEEEEIFDKDGSFKDFLSQLRRNKASAKYKLDEVGEVDETSETAVKGEESREPEETPSGEVSGNEERNESEDSFKAFLSQLKKKNSSDDMALEEESD